MLIMAKRKAAPPKSPGEMTSVGMTVGARDKLTAFCVENQGMNFKDVLTTIAEWFVVQPTLVQSVVLGHARVVPEGYAQALEAMAAEVRKLTPEQLIQVFERGVGQSGGGVPASPDTQKTTPNPAETPAENQQDEHQHGARRGRKLRVNKG